MRHSFAPSAVTIAMICVLSAVSPAVSQDRQSSSDTAPVGANPFDSPDGGFDRFPIPDDLPPLAGTFPVPKAGPWDVMNFLGQMTCTGVVSLNLPLDPVRDSGTLEILNGGQTIFGKGLTADTEDMTMQRVPGPVGRYAGTVAGSPGGVPMSIDFFWQLVTDEWIVGYLTSHVDTQGMTCDMFRTYELKYTGGPEEEESGREEEESDRNEEESDRNEEESDRDGAEELRRR